MSNLIRTVLVNQIMIMRALANLSLEWNSLSDKRNEKTRQIKAELHEHIDKTKATLDETARTGAT